MKSQSISNLKAVSLFASGGIGDLALRENGIDVIVANELLAERAAIFQHNFPYAKMIVGDIWEKKQDIINTTREMLGNQELDFLLATPPCQGMSKNGQGKLLKGVREGKRPKIDPRNRLIIPTLEIVKALRPKVIVFENVPEMLNTVIDDEQGQLINVIDFIKKSLGSEYEGKAEVMSFADYGIPQRRSRLITVFSRIEMYKDIFRVSKTFLPPITHSKNAVNGLKKWVSVRDVISGLPFLDGKNKESAVSSIPYHYVPVLDPKKYIWISNTPPEKGAFDNQCNNPKCMYNKNPIHGSSRDESGINRANGETPIRCVKCGELLPRPYVVTNNEYRIMSGYTSAYKRMNWDLPSPTLTTNLCYPSSDHKLHPEQNRVLSLLEAFKLHTLDQYNFEWVKDDQKAKDSLIIEIIGESIPPKGLSIIITHLLNLKEVSRSPRSQGQLNLAY